MVKQLFTRFGVLNLGTNGLQPKSGVSISRQGCSMRFHIFAHSAMVVLLLYDII